MTSAVRNIITSIRHPYAYSIFNTNDREAINIVPTAVWQNVLLAYNLMSATIPALTGLLLRSIGAATPASSGRDSSAVTATSTPERGRPGQRSAAGAATGLPGGQWIGTVPRPPTPPGWNGADQSASTPTRMAGWSWIRISSSRPVSCVCIK